MVQEVRDARTQRNCVDKFFVEVLHDAFTEITGTISQFPAVDRKELYDAVWSFEGGSMKTKLRNMWAFVVGFFTSHLPYRTQWTSFDELAAYNQGRSCACELMGKDEYE